MAKIKIKDLTKGIKITEEELKQVRGGWTKISLPAIGVPHFPLKPTYPDYELCQNVIAGGCGRTG